MWLHKHGWHYFRSNITSIYNNIKQDQQHADGYRKDISQLKTTLTELLDHIRRIEEEMKKEDNMFKLIEKVIYDIHLVNKLKNREAFDTYENKLSDEFKRMDTLYLSLKKSCVNAIESLVESETNKKHVIDEVTGVVNDLRDIENISKEMAQYLKKTLPKIEEYKEWIKKQEEGTEWVENNIRSWIRTAEETK